MNLSKPLHTKVAEDPVPKLDPDLSNLIEFANMVPADAPLPLFPDDKCLSVWGSLDEAAQEREFKRFLDENFPRSKFRKFHTLFGGNKIAALLDKANPRFSLPALYTLVRESREALRMIATHRREQSLWGAFFFFPLEHVGEWKVDRIRLCENCEKLFFANRKNKLTCSDQCSNARRVREWRKHKPLYEQARKLKLARSSKEIPTKTKKQKESSPREQGSQGGKNGTQKTR